jgi:hypothetical protein
MSLNQKVNRLLPNHFILTFELIKSSLILLHNRVLFLKPFEVIGIFDQFLDSLEFPSSQSIHRSQDVSSNILIPPLLILNILLLLSSAFLNRIGIRSHSKKLCILKIQLRIVNLENHQSPQILTEIRNHFLSRMQQNVVVERAVLSDQPESLSGRIDGQTSLQNIRVKNLPLNIGRNLVLIFLLRLCFEDLGSNQPTRIKTSHGLLGVTWDSSPHYLSDELSVEEVFG